MLKACKDNVNCGTFITGAFKTGIWIKTASKSGYSKVSCEEMQVPKATNQAQRRHLLPTRCNDIAAFISSRSNALRRSIGVCYQSIAKPLRIPIAILKCQSSCAAPDKVE